MKTEKKNYHEIMEAASAYIIQEKPHMNGPKEVADFLRPMYQGKMQEQFIVLLLNTKNRILHFFVATTGLVDCAQIHAREVFREAILNNTTRIILAHNHPSGDPMPSAQDIESTRRLTSAGKIIGIEVVDHIVVGQKTTERSVDFMSFREANLL